MKITLNRSTRSSKYSDIVISNEGNDITLHNAFEFLGAEPDLKLFDEINAHWERRSKRDQKAIFRLYLAITNSADNYLYINEGTDVATTIMHSIKPFINPLLNMHSWSGMISFWKNVYADQIPEQFPETKDDFPNILEELFYTRSQFRDLQVLTLMLRILTPIMLVIQRNVRASQMTRIDSKVFSQSLFQILLLDQHGVMETAAMVKLRMYVATLMDGTMARDQGLTPNDLTARVIFNRMAITPISVKNESRNMLVIMYNYMVQSMRAYALPKHKNKVEGAFSHPHLKGSKIMVNQKFADVVAQAAATRMGEILKSVHNESDEDEKSVYAVTFETLLKANDITPEIFEERIRVYAEANCGINSVKSTIGNLVKESHRKQMGHTIFKRLVKAVFPATPPVYVDEAKRNMNEALASYTGKSEQ